MIRLSLLRSPAVGLDWHEAIAVTAALAELVSDEPLTGVPGLDEVGLLPDGSLHTAGGVAETELSVRALAARLASLIAARPCPLELRQFVDRNLADPPEHDTIAGFAEGLAFFERPDRGDTLRALVKRAPDALERARVADELERLTDRARLLASSAPAAPALQVEERRSAGRVRQYALPIVAPVAVFLAMAVAVGTWFSWAPTDTRTASDLKQDLDDDRGPVGSTPPEATAAADLDVERDDPVAAVGPTPTRGPRPAPAARSLPGAAGSPSSSVDVRVTELGGAAVSASARPPGRTVLPPSPPVTSRVYVAGDPGVTPPRLVRPHLPAEPPPDVPPEQIGTLELVVNERGTVDHVVLVSPANRYQERMLVAAAKAWQFDPATRQGRPVRFRARIRVTL